MGVIFTMNAPKTFYQLQYKRKLTEQANAFRSLMGRFGSDKLKRDLTMLVNTGRIRTK